MEGAAPLSAYKKGSRDERKQSTMRRSRKHDLQASINNRSTSMEDNDNHGTEF